MKRSTSDDSDDELLFSKLSKRRKESFNKDSMSSITENCKSFSNIAQKSIASCFESQRNQMTKDKKGSKFQYKGTAKLQKTARKKTGKYLRNDKLVFDKTPDKPKDTNRRCPICQAPYSCLTIESPGWHRQECGQLSLKRKKGLAFICLFERILNNLIVIECPQGENCNSQILGHYERYNHAKLAKLRTRQDSK